ncbi:YrzI family small protein [Metabacillus sp. RGM 3146]
MTINLFFITISISQKVRSEEQFNRDLEVHQLMEKAKDRQIQVMSRL